MKYRLIDYFDVWKDEYEEWYVNNQCVLYDDIYIDSDSTKQEIIDFLYNIKYLANNNLDNFEVIWDDFIEILSAADGMPLCRLEEIFDPKEV